MMTLPLCLENIKPSRARGKPIEAYITSMPIGVGPAVRIALIRKPTAEFGDVGDDLHYSRRCLLEWSGTGALAGQRAW